MWIDIEMISKCKPNKNKLINKEGLIHGKNIDSDNKLIPGKDDLILVKFNIITVSILISTKKILFVLSKTLQLC